ncbi:MAG: alpha-amylase family glycosyl hydrolase, partial [Pseudomonadota bacterium]|nr:alpha-amylase family glycosyl hydrolase [Pseudomonadota bacterium]
GLPVVTLEVLIPLEVGGLAAAVAVWRAVPPGRAPLRLFLPLAVFTEDRLPADAASAIGHLPGSAGILGDAVADDEFLRALVRLMLAPRADSGELRAGNSAELHRAGLLPKVPWRIRRGSAEQSNTSVRIGDASILKILRKLEQGMHPELEVGRFLTQQAHFGAAPAMLGWLEVDDTTLCVLQSFVPNEGDGWSWVLARLREGSVSSRQQATQWISGLGATTAELHDALSTETDDPAFKAEAVTQADWDGWIDSTRAMAERVATGLKRARPSLEPQAIDLADAFAGRVEEIGSMLREWVPGEGLTLKTRCHGDYHLGQVLVSAAGGATIVDFEGEPLRPLAERRAKQVPLRDVAGMLRSFGYAAAVATREAPADGGLLAAWSADASERFLDAYLNQRAMRRAAPVDRAVAMSLLRFFLLEKALYDVSYEMANRPDWVQIPLSSVLSVLRPSAVSPTRRAHRMAQGTDLLDEGGVRFRLWAPRFEQMKLAFYRAAQDEAPVLLPMQSVEDGWHEISVDEAGAGSRYSFELPDGMRVPDPVSRFQPSDVHGPSEVIDPAEYAWQDPAWQGRPWHEAVIYEMHIGTFTQAGTFRAAIDRLAHLADLGVTAIELMPIGDFPGRRNWGYDGVLLYAPDSTYGRPGDLKALIDAAHGRGIMVILDVVYNHFGPDGNYLPVYAPAFFTDRHKTPWGAAVNFDGPHSRPVREFVIHNALYWIEEYHFDGLRFDAVHAIIDDSSRHVLSELAERVRAIRPNAHLILENEENQGSLLTRGVEGTPAHYTAQWNDDLHHVLHVVATAEKSGYYADYADD